MKKAARRTLAAVLAVFLLAGCGPQAQDDDDVQIIEDEKEQVYIFPDGTKIRGQAGEWTLQAVRDIMAQEPEHLWEPASVQEIKDELAYPEHDASIPTPRHLPQGFHLTAGFIDAHPTVQAARVIWVSPHSKEAVVADVTIEPDATDQDDPFWPFAPLCSEQRHENDPVWARTRCIRQGRFDIYFIRWVLYSSNDALAAQRLLEGEMAFWPD